MKVSAGIPRLAGRRRILPATGFRVLKKLRKRMVAGQGGAEGAKGLWTLLCSSSRWSIPSYCSGVLLHLSRVLWSQGRDGSRGLWASILRWR